MAVCGFAAPCLAALAPEWEADGLIVSTGNGERTSISVVPDKTGGTYIVWAEKPTNKPWHIRAQHLLADGTCAENWIPTGLRLSTDRDTVSRPLAIADEQGGAWVAWYQNRFGIPSIRITHLKAEGPTIDDYGRTIARFAMGAVAPQDKLMLASSRDGSVYAMWQDNTAGGYYPKRVAVNRYLSTLYQASGFGGNGNTMMTHSPHGVPEWFPKAGIADTAGALVMPSTSVSHGGCHHDQCWDDYVYYTTTTMYPDGQGAEGGGWNSGEGGRISAVGLAQDRHTGFDLLIWAGDNAYSISRISLSPVTRQWVRRLSTASNSDFDHRLVRTSDGGSLHLSLRLNATGVDLVGEALQSDGTPKPALSPLTFYGSDQTSPISALVPDRRAGVVFLRSSAGPSGLDLWLGEYSGNPGLDEGLTPFAVAAGDQKDGALGNATDGAIYAAWVDARTGTQTVRVQRLVESLPTATQQVALSAVAASGGVHVRIECGADQAIRLERARLGGDWVLLAQLDSGREGFVEYEDRTDLPVGQVGYRATTALGSSSESWVEWKPAAGFGLLDVRTSPGEGAFRVALSIEPVHPAELELFDLHGRRLDRVRIPSGTVGPESFELGHRGLRSGLLLVRLSQGVRRSSLRAVLVR